MAYLLTHRAGACSTCNFSDMDALSLACLGLEVSDLDCDYWLYAVVVALLSSTVGFHRARLQLLSTSVLQCLLSQSLGRRRLTSDDKHCYYVLILNLWFLEFVLFYVQECLDCMYCTTCMHGAHRGPKRTLGSLQEEQVFLTMQPPPQPFKSLFLTASLKCYYHIRVVCV